jgi:hypothetical protein
MNKNVFLPTSRLTGKKNHNGIFREAMSESNDQNQRFGN